jgi:hypothetical protein
VSGDDDSSALFGLPRKIRVGALELPSLPLLVVGSVVVLGGCALLVRGAVNNRRRKDQERTDETA